MLTVSGRSLSVVVIGAGRRVEDGNDFGGGHVGLR